MPSLPSSAPVEEGEELEPPKPRPNIASEVDENKRTKTKTNKARCPENHRLRGRVQRSSEVLRIPTLYGEGQLVVLCCLACSCG